MVDVRVFPRIFCELELISWIHKPESQKAYDEVMAI